MNSIRRSIVTSILAACLVVALVVFGLVYLVVRQQIVEEYNESLLIRAEALSGLIEIENGQYALDQHESAVDEYDRLERPAYFEIRNAAGQTLLRSQHLSKALSCDPRSAGSGAIRDLELPDGRLGRVAAIDVVPRIEWQAGYLPTDREIQMKAEAVWILVADDLHEMQSPLRRTGAALLAAFAVLAVLLLLLIPRLVSRGLKPLQALSARASQIDAAHLSERFPTETLPSELVSISRQLNLSLDRISAAFERERRFAASAAHELRTPLAAIRTNAEVALKWPDLPQMQSSMRDILHSEQRMQTLVDHLLELARLNHQQQQAAMMDVDLPTLVNESIHEIEPLASSRQLSIERSLPARATVKSNPAYLRPLLTNLLANAATHADHGSQIRIECFAQASGVLKIANRTAELQPDDIKHLFEPLWRKSRDRSTGGAGLGLALAAEYARVLGAAVHPILDDRNFSISIIFPS